MRDVDDCTCLPEGRSWKRLWEGWVGSFTILFALLEHRVRKISRMEGRGAPMIFRHELTEVFRLKSPGSSYRGNRRGPAGLIY